VNIILPTGCKGGILANLFFQPTRFKTQTLPMLRRAFARRQGMTKIIFWSYQEKHKTSVAHNPTSPRAFRVCLDFGFWTPVANFQLQKHYLLL
jgi:hypothetical protein